MQNSKKTVSIPEKYRYSLRPKKLSSFLPAMVSLLFFSISSCNTLKNSIYFQDLQKDTTIHNVVAPDFDLKIQRNDLLGISVASLSPDVAFYNAAQASAGTSSSGNTSAAASSGSAYPIDSAGNITFVKLGPVHVVGLTRKQLKDTLEKALVPYLKDVVVSVSFLNRHVTMMGGVSPQVLPMAGDNMTILDAIASSGDIGMKGKIDNILVIRDDNHGKVFKRLSLKDHSIFYSPYYYLQPNDIVYVEPAKVQAPITTPQIISYITAGISLIILILNSVKL